MSRNRKLNKKKSNQNLGDVTINDFANIPIMGKDRLRKSASNNFITKINNLSLDEETWDVDDDVKVTVGRRSTSGQKSSENERIDSDFYPIVIWCLISEFIKPEDVGRFALICRTSYEIVNSSRFWFCLYKRYYRPVKEMPERLQPPCMTRLYELKSCVIRALHYMYPPFVSKCCIDSNKFLSIYHPTDVISAYSPLLIKRKCMSVWSEQLHDNYWKCSFILKREDPNVTHKSTQTRNTSDFLSVFDDIFANKAEGCLLLQVIQRKFIVTPSVLGFKLKSVKFDSNDLNMMFCTGITSSCDIINITFSYVEEVHAHNWWSPHYPHSDTFSLHSVSYLS